MANQPTATQVGNKILAYIVFLFTGRVMVPFYKTVSITSAAAATAVSIVADSEVPQGFTPFIATWRCKVGGATAWATTATVSITDTAASPVSFASIAVAAMTGNAFISWGSASVTPGAAFYNNTGGTINKGLQVKGNANGTGSTAVFTVFGWYEQV